MNDETPSSGPPRPESRRVLLADNDANVAAVLEAFLRRRGLAVEVAHDGGAALERLRSGGIDLLVCDLDMPVLSGEALLDRVAGAPDCPPVVVISGYVDEATVARLGRHAAVREVLRKPFDVRAFAERAARLADGDGRPAADGGLF